MNYYCYLIQSKLYPNHTYIGYTNNPEKRLKKHNKILKGGAKSTRKHSDWEINKLVKFSTKKDALSFEWYWKHTKNRKGKWTRTRSGIDNKIKRLYEIIVNYECEIIT